VGPTTLAVGDDRLTGRRILNLFVLAIRLRVPAAELRQAIFAYPTNGSDVRFML